MKHRVTYREFTEWLLFLSQEEEHKHKQELEHVSKQDFLLAQVAAEVRRTVVKRPTSVRVEDFLPRVHKRSSAPADAAASKAAWAGFLGIKLPPSK